ncbi:hypothetical protein N7539_007269 [Penicillium diatomitis]|uniref:3-beta hydroxysteroid dehydrogenase/isomerase domain-containing protein n=1 Tax=Penicillium diatomitis TaxID=2819901 RepID=A0A9X0BNR1_9EURO|nr:uncharacterized protein N7539_007269 [Penicillium diatomitis]KAJ5477125.1 hypothetical protein N7539_007269 [Penicillium diatomitis]
MLYMILLALGLAALYLIHVNAAMKRVPEEAHRASPTRWTTEEVKATYERILKNDVDVVNDLPPKQSRRYIVVGGSGLVGAWIVSHLLARGEDPASLRILDLAAPTAEILERGVAYFKTDITDQSSVSAAFTHPWLAQVAQKPLTVFHTAAIIRPYERLERYLPLSEKVNVHGARNVLQAAKESSASCFISTSSGSVNLHKPSFWITPWERVPRRAVQILSDQAQLPQRHDEFFSNYARTKLETERFVCAADDQTSGFRTGCIRPANGIYGVGNETSGTVVGLYLRSGGSPTWTSNIIHSFINAENVSVAHLLYEQRLIEQSQPSSTLPNIGGQSFVVTDPNPAISFEDIYTLLVNFSKTPVSFPRVEPLPLYIIAHLVEAYVYIQDAWLPWLLPKIKGDLLQLQPSLFAISDVFCIADDSRARKAPADGGLGYRPTMSTLEGMCKELVKWNQKATAKTVRDIQDKVADGPVVVGPEGIEVKLVAPEKSV